MEETKNYRCCINSEENELFREWQDTNYPDTDESLFTFDGLHHMGLPSKESGAWQNKHVGNKNELRWIVSYVRPIFFTKDYNLGGESEAIDSRCDTGLDNDYEEPKMAPGFHTVLASMLHFLFAKDIRHGIIPSLEEFEKDKKSGALNCYYYYRCPWARINMKKIAGESDCSESELRKAIAKDRNFLTRQLDIYYGANVLICCDGRAWSVSKRGGNAIMDFLFNRYPDLQGYKSNPSGRDTWVYYSSSSNVVVLHVWHPSRHTPADEYPAFKELASFLKANPDFLKRVMPE